MPYIRCEECDWTFDAARRTCPLCGRCAVCGATLQQLAQRHKTRRREQGGPVTRGCQHTAEEAKTFSGVRVPEREVGKLQRRFGARRRTVQSETIVAMIIGTMFGSPVAFFILPKFGVGLIDFTASVLSGAVLGYAVNRALRYLRPGGLYAPAAELRLHQGRDLREYAELLDEFEIELAVPRLISRTIEYAGDFTAAKPSTRSGAYTDERRLLFPRVCSPAHIHDQELLRRAGMALTGDELILVCIPTTLEKRLLRLEYDHAFGDVAHIGKTVFGVRRVRGRHEFYVVEQTRDFAGEIGVVSQRTGGL